MLNPQKSILENIQESSPFSEIEIRNSLAQFLFTKDVVFQKVSSLSGGEKLRACLAKGFLQSKKIEMLILDEPTNNLDLANIEYLEQLIKEFKGAIILISHDPIFVKNCGIDQELDLNK